MQYNGDSQQQPENPVLHFRAGGGTAGPTCVSDIETLGAGNIPGDENAVLPIIRRKATAKRERPMDII